MHSNIDPSFPKYLNIELTARCNKSCDFCETQKDPYYERHQLTGDISIDVVKKVVDSLPNEVNITFHKDGEPLVYKNLKDALVIAYSHFTHFCTNGKLLERKHAQILGYVDLITISITDDDPDQEKIILKFLARVHCGSYKGKKTRVNIKTFTSDMHRKWSLLHNDVFLQEYHNWASQGGVEYGDNSKKLMGMCASIQEKIAVNFDGTVSACCLDYNHKLILGSVDTQSVKDIWNGDNLRALRGMLKNNTLPIDSICTHCEFRVPIRKV